jgi:hypothetical protein
MLYEETWYEPDYDESEEIMDEPEVYCQFFKVSIDLDSAKFRMKETRKSHEISLSLSGLCKG